MSTDPKAPRPSCAEVIAQTGATAAKYSGSVVLITGASNGIGVETARAYASLGMEVYMPVRDRKRGEAAIADIESSVPTAKGKLHLLDLDLGSLASVRACAAEFLKQSQKLNFLVLNAGIMMTPEGKTVDGFETQFGTNYVAHYLLTRLLLPTLVASSSPSLVSRVVSLSSLGHGTCGIQFGDFDFAKQGYQRLRAYGQSKTGNIYLASEVERRYGAKGVRALSVHPGTISTGLGVHISAQPISADELTMLGLFPDQLAAVFATLKTVDQGAATTVYATLSPEFDEKGGFYLENVGISRGLHVTFQPDRTPDTPRVGMAPWINQPDLEQRLWKETAALIGLSEED